MAIFHFSAQIISRAAGRSSVAASAYRSASRMVDERTGEIHDFGKKGGVALSEVLAPTHAPDWMRDRVALWNGVEAVEKRRDAQLAREINVALPVELDQAQQLALVRDYVRRELVDRGMVAQVDLHDLDSHNPHAHIMVTMRTIEGEGFGKKERSWNDKQLLEHWREEWANTVNRHLELAGRLERVDHRSLQDQGIDRQPTQHLGPHALAIEERTGEKSDKRLAMEADMKARAQAAALEKVRQVAVAAQIAAAEREAAQLARELEQAIEAEAQQPRAQTVVPTQSSAEIRRAIEQADENLRRQGRELIAQDPRVRAAHQAAMTSWEVHKRTHDQAQQASQLVKSRGGRMKQCRQLAGEWRRSNRFRAWWHDHVRTVATLASLEADARQATGRWEKAKDAAAQAQRHDQAALAAYEAKNAELDQVKKDVAQEVLRGQRPEWEAVRELEAKFNDAQQRENELMYQQSLEFDPEPPQPPQERSRSRDDYELDR